MDVRSQGNRQKQGKVDVMMQQNEVEEEEEKM